MTRGIERLVRVDEPEVLGQINGKLAFGQISGRLELDGVEARVEIRAKGDTLTGINARCAGMVIDGPYVQVLELLGRPMRSRLSDVVRALTVRMLEIAIGMERMETAAADIRIFIVRGGLAERYFRRLSDALRATEGLFDASLECSQGCMLDAHQTGILWAGWQALGAGEDCDLAAAINEGRFEYHLVCRIMPELDDIVAFIEGVC